MVWHKNGGQLRECIGKLKSLFKDGSFQKQVGSGFGARVRTNAIRREMVKAEAEAKFGDALRETKRELQKAARQQEIRHEESGRGKTEKTGGGSKKGRKRP